MTTSPSETFGRYYRTPDLTHPGLSAVQFFDGEDGFSAQDIIDQIGSRKLSTSYRKLHTRKYLDRIDGLSDQCGPLPKDTKAVLVVAARNETMTARAIDEVRRGVDPGENPTIVYHNFVKPPDSDVRRAMNGLRDLPAVWLVEEQVEGSGGVASAKKVAGDIAVNLVNKDGPKNLPLIFFDADVTGTSDGLLADTVSALGGRTSLCVSPDVMYDPETLSPYPVFAEVNTLQRKINEALFGNSLAWKAATGQYIGVNMDTYQALGGFKPAFSYHEDFRHVPFEDMHFTKEVYGLTSLTPGIIPDPHEYVEPLVPSVVMTDPSREIGHLMRGLPLDYRWQTGAHYSETTGTRRPDITGYPLNPAVPELGPLTEENLSGAVDNFWRRNFPYISFSSYGQLISGMLLDFLEARGASPILTMKTQEGLIKCPFEEARRLLSEDGSLFIRRIGK